MWIHIHLKESNSRPLPSITRLNILCLFKFVYKYVYENPFSTINKRERLFYGEFIKWFSNMNVLIWRNSHCPVKIHSTKQQKKREYCQVMHRFFMYANNMQIALWLFNFIAAHISLSLSLFFIPFYEWINVYRYADIHKFKQKVRWSKFANNICWIYVVVLAIPGSF